MSDMRDPGPYVIEDVIEEFADGESVAPLDYACCGERSRALATDGVDVVVLDGSGAAAYRAAAPGRRDVAVGKSLVQLSRGEGGEACSGSACRRRRFLRQEVQAPIG